MAGTIKGGKAAAKKNIASDPDFYQKIGAKGGKKSKGGGFAAGAEGRERARIYGSLGGQIAMYTRWRGGLTDKQRKAIRAKHKAKLEASYKHLLKVHEGANR